MDIATPTLQTPPAAPVFGIDAAERHRGPGAAPVRQYYGLSREEEFLLPLLAWSDPIVEPELRRVAAVLDWLAEQAPDCIDATTNGRAIPR